MKDKKSKIKKGRNSGSSSYKSVKWFTALVFSIAFIVGINTINHDFTLDDEIYYSGNKYVQKGFSGIGDIFTHGSTSGFKEINKKELYRPFVSLSFIVEKELFRNNPKASHFVQLLLYAYACLLLFGLLKMFFPASQYPVPFFIVLLFAVHPVHTEVIASIKSRDELLAFIFSIGCLKQVIQYGLNQKVKHFVLSGLYFLLALLSKESAVYLLGIIPLTYYFFSPFIKSVLVRLTGLSVLVFCIYFFLRMQIISLNFIGTKPDLINNALMGAGTVFEEYGTAIVIIGLYIIRLFIPYPLSYDYSFNQIPLITDFSWSFILTLMVLLVLIIYSLVTFRKKNPIAYGILFFLITLFPVSNLLLKIDATMGYRFLFTPVIGFIMATVFCLLRLLKGNVNSDQNGEVTKKLQWFLIPIVAIFFILTIIRNADWKNNFTLFSHDVEVCPSSSRIQSSLAFELSKIGMTSGNAQAKSYYLEQAKYHYRECVKIYPQHPDAWYNLALVYYNLNNIDSAKISLHKANEVNPVIKAPLKELGGIYYNAKQNDSALFYFKKVLILDATDKDANSIVSYIENQE